jgi:hypothetical protein
MTAIGPYSMATVPLYSPTRQICMGKVADCDSLLTVLSKYVPNYYECVVRAKMEHVYADPASKYTIFAFDRLTCDSRERAISYCRDTTYEGEILPLALTSSSMFMLPTMGTNSLLVESPDGQSIYINKKPVSMSIACGNGIVYMIL